MENIKQGLFALSIFDKTTGEEVNSEDQVSVGDSMRITVTTTDPAITDFFLADCTASDGKEAPDVPKSLKMIEDGCMVAIDSPLNLQTASPNPGHFIDYRQFGFVDSDSTLELLFKLTCNIRLGTAPTDADCQPARAGRKRRQTEQTEFTQTTGTFDFLSTIILA